MEQLDCLAPWNHLAAVQVSIIMWYLAIFNSNVITGNYLPSRINDSGGLMDPPGNNYGMLP